MKNSFFYLIVFITTFAFSQSEKIPAGSYYSEDESMGFYLIVDENNNFQLSMAKGKITNDTISNLEILKQKTPIFGIRFTEKNTTNDSLTITFSEKFKSYHLSQIYIGATNTADGKPNYLKASELNNSNLYDEKNVSFKIEKTNYIQLLEETYKKDFNILYTYEIPKNVSKVEITYHPSQRRDFKLHATYDAKKDVVTVNEIKRNNPLKFYKDFDKHLEEFEEPKAVKENIIWKSEETAIEPSTYTYKPPYTFQLKTFNSYDEALQTTKNDNKLLLAFYLSNGSQNEQNYTTFLKNYEQKVSNMMFDNYKEDYDRFHFYLIPKENKKNIEELDLKENELLVLDGNQSIIYRHKAPITDLNKEILEQISSYSRNDFYDMNLMKRLDDAIQEKEFDALKTQRIFNDLANITAMDFFSGHKSVTEKTYREKEYIKSNSIYYKLQSNVEQVDQLFEKLIKSHSKDVNADFQFADIISKIQTSNYKGLLYKNYEIGNPEIQLQAIDYLIKFQDELKNYIPASDETYYDFYNISFTISSYLNRVANKADKNLLQKVKQRFKKLKTEDNKYLSFLKRFIPEDYLKEYMDYYDKNDLGANENIIVRLDQMYEEANSKKAWDIYKSQIANEANEAAWVVVEKITDKKLLKEALKWSKTSLDIKAKNPYYLDTYAQLLYKNGDKKSAIKYQTKAVNIISEDVKRYSTYLLKTTRDVLDRMKSGTY